MKMNRIVTRGILAPQILDFSPKQPNLYSHRYLFTLWTIDSAKSLAAIKAASLQTFATSAPVKPGVKADNFRARSSLSTLVFNPSKCTLKIDALPY